MLVVLVVFVVVVVVAFPALPGVIEYLLNKIRGLKVSVAEFPEDQVSQCKWHPVVLPVPPIKPITCPSETVLPTDTEMELKCP